MRTRAVPCKDGTIMVRWLLPALGHQVGDETKETDQRADHLTRCGLCESVESRARQPALEEVKK